MSKANKYLIAALAASQLSTISAYAGDDDIKDKFNPILTAVTSQSIAADARAAAMGDLVPPPIPMSTLKAGTQQNIPSPFRVRVSP